MNTTAVEVPSGYKGILHNLPAEDYHAAPALGSTSIKALGDPEISLFEAKYLMDNNEHKKVYDVGTLAHALILEGSLDNLIRRVDFDNYRSGAARQERDMAYNDGLIPVNNSEVESVLGAVYEMRNAVMDHPIAADLLTGHDPEVSLFWEQGGVPLKARIDALHTSVRIAVDLKTIRSARPNEVRKQISDLGYYIQARDYLNGLKEVTGDDYDWYFVMVQSSEPYTVSVHQISEHALDEAQVRIGHAIDRYQRALEKGWAGYEEIFTQELTIWESSKNETLEDTIMEII